MNGKEIREYFNSKLSDNNINCTIEELNEFMTYGLLLKSKDNYLYNGDVINVDILKNTIHNFNINLSAIVNNCIELSKKNNCKKVYCMSQKTYDKYKELGLIVNSNGNEYYKKYEKDMWLIYLI